MGNTESIHLAYGSDDNYWFYTAISAASAAFGVNSCYGLAIHLFDLGITDEHYVEFVDIVRRASKDVCCERHRLRVDDFSAFGAWKGSIATYSRMFVAELLPDLDWVIYVDGDTLWLGDIAKLWQLRDSSCLIQASYDPPPRGGLSKSPEFVWYREHGLSVDPSQYLCMGLMMANLQMMRKDGIPDKCKEFMKKFPSPRVVDQTVLNYVCKGRIKQLPKEWGVFSGCHGIADLSDHGCVHYVTDVPWKRPRINRLFSDIIMLWFYFAQEVLGKDLQRQYFSWWQSFWRRTFFKFLKANQWLVDLHPFIRGRFRNTYGLPDDIMKHWLESFKTRR